VEVAQESGEHNQSDVQVGGSVDVERRRRRKLSREREEEKKKMTCRFQSELR